MRNASDVVAIYWATLFVWSVVFVSINCIYNVYPYHVMNMMSCWISQMTGYVYYTWLKYSHSIIMTLMYYDALMDISYGIDHFSVRFHEKIFIPFESTDFVKRLSIFLYWSRFAFFLNINRDMFQIFKYYVEDPFHQKCQKVLKNEYFSMIRMNIRSLPANLNHVMNYLNCLNVQFSALCFSETW